MFAIPGICGLIALVLARPQEFVPALQRIPLLHIFALLAVFGWVLDIRLRRLQPVAAPSLPWVIALFAWAVIGTAVVVPEKLGERVLELAILFALYGTIAHGVQRFRTFQIVAGTMVATCLWITVVCFHQGFAAHQCIAGIEGTDGMIGGTPDGRSCDRSEQCMVGDAEPGKEYRCERVGLVGTYSIEGRVRYRGELHDPNEVALTISAGALSLLIGFALRRRTPLGMFVCVLGVLLVVATVLLTRSRGGLVAALLVPGVYVIRRYGVLALAPAATLGLTVVALVSRGGEKASLSTELRYEAWATGLEMFKRSPTFGVGARQFGEHHFMTAHNSYVLALAELGFVGLVLFVAVLFVSVKTLVVGLRDLAHTPGAAAVQVWGMALIASLCGILFQINTLSFAYHSVLWLFLGLVGAWASAIRTHVPTFRVRLGGLDLAAIVAGCLAFTFVVLPVFLRWKGMY